MNKQKEEKKRMTYGTGVALECDTFPSHITSKRPRITIRHC